MPSTITSSFWYVGLLSLFVSAAPFGALAGDCYADPVRQFAGSGTVISGVFLRDQACMTGSTILKTLSAGTSVQVIGFTDGWYRVESAGARGWVGMQFVSTSAEPTGATWSSYDAYMSEFPSRYTPPSSPPPAASGEAAYTGMIDARMLIKLVCPAGALLDHPCRAVYYVGADGKRHAFPNSRAYFTWYQNFDAVKAVTQERLGAYPLGANITYRPGYKLVKFTTDPKVYAVARGGVLRWIKTEALAIAFYGTDWNKKVDDISDVFYTNYTFGAEIASESDYSPTTELTLASTFD